MRSTTTFLSLLVAASAPVVLAAPIPGNPSAGWERRLAVGASRKFLRLHELSPEAAAALADEAGPNAIVIDNRHYTPSGDSEPSAVLATPRPIVTTYLMGLGATKPRVAKTTKSASTGGDATLADAPVPIRLQNANEGIEVVIIDADVEAALEAAKAIAGTPNSSPVISPVAVDPLDSAEQAALLNVDVPESVKMESQPLHHKARPATDVPCQYAQLRRENDMMVIGLVAIFLLVIVAVELYESSTERKPAQDAPVGAIKLDIDEISEKRPLSVQASPVSLTSTEQ
ncbi:hypothetical protein SPBR_00885 [Sporothrix brasiliensis 5110]|uniref:Protein BIG1 n=1 Tax=Sporothrix brasiliensis 5110 TaxID=1398154 RepID=A0A0C2IUN1_9PEZI|nr:uncharacterized protein SPBR_00885 [Sporothrix brasiliensis 5110]KIH90480.1 hypothetical protein SPBR_00885 [Sporothrix brasiliensis 5110]